MIRPDWPRRWGRPLLVVMTVALVSVAGAGGAAAHDVLVSTSPANGALVSTVPKAVTLLFDQPALAIGTEVVVNGPSGAVQLGKATIVDSTVTQRVEPGAPAGHYTVNWRVTSADGHPVSGTFTFTARAAGAGVVPTRSAASGTTQPTASKAGSALPWVLLVAAVLLLSLVAGTAMRSRRHPVPGRSRG